LSIIYEKAMKAIVLCLAFLIVGGDFCSGMNSSKEKNSKKLQQRPVTAKIENNKKSKTKKFSKKFIPENKIDDAEMDFYDDSIDIEELRKMRAELVKNKERQNKENVICLFGVEIDFQSIDGAIVFIDFEILRRGDIEK
jgi:hypothetical protein